MSEKKLRDLLSGIINPKTFYRTMHYTHPGYRNINHGIRTACEWLHLLRNRRGEVHNPWSAEHISVLELGCGNGKLCNLLSDMKMDVTGLDITLNAIVYDRSAYKFIEYDLTAVPYPFRDGEFDYCLSFDVLEHLPEESIDGILKEMARISRGIIVKVSCTGQPPLHITIESPPWWLDRLITICPDFSWRLLNNYERLMKWAGGEGYCLDETPDIRPLKDEDGEITYSPLFYGKRGAADEG